MVYSMGINGK